MGLRFGVVLLFPRPQVRSALAALARIADPSGGSRCVLSLPGEEPLSVPFEGYAEDEVEPLVALDLARVDRYQWLDGSFWLPVDDAVRAYLERRGPCFSIGEDGVRTLLRPATRSTGTGEEVSIGCFGVSVLCGARYAVIRVGSATSSMGYLLEESTAIRERFLQLVGEAGGVGALLDRGTGTPYEMLDASRRSVELSEYDWEDPAGTVDPFVEAALAAPPPKG